MPTGSRVTPTVGAVVLKGVRGLADVVGAMPPEAPAPAPDTDPVITDALEPATLSRRVAAYGCDLLIAGLLGLPFLALGYRRPGAYNDDMVYWWAYAMFLTVTGVEIMSGRSPGKWLLRLEVLDQRAGTPAWPRATVRWFLRFLPVHCLVLQAGLDWLPRDMLVFDLTLLLSCWSLVRMLFTRPPRALHDVWTSTMVFAASPPRPAFPVVIPSSVQK